MEDSKNAFWRTAAIISVFVMVLSAIALVFIIIGTSNANADAQRLETSLAQRKNVLALIDDNAVPSVKELEQVTYSAKETGEKITALVNKAVSDIYFASASDMDRLEEIKESLNYVYDKLNANSMTNGADWFFCTEDGVSSEWTFVTTWECTKSTIECVWICRYKDYEEPMAYATATYSAANDSFSNFAYHVTTVGFGVNDDIQSRVAEDPETEAK